MKIYILLFIYFLVSISSFSQVKFVPTVVVLYPNEIIEDSVSIKELNYYRQDVSVTEEFKKKFLHEGLTANWKIIRERELSFMSNQNFYTAMVLSITHELVYREIENRSSLIIYPLKQPVGNSLFAYKKLADQHKVSWIVNMVRTDATSIGDKRILNIKIHLYNVVTNRLFIEKEYMVNSTMITLSEECSDIWLCMFNSIQGTIVFDLSDKIEKNIRYERL